MRCVARSVCRMTGTTAALPILPVIPFLVLTPPSALSVGRGRCRLEKPLWSLVLRCLPFRLYPTGTGAGEQSSYLDDPYGECTEETAPRGDSGNTLVPSPRRSRTPSGVLRRGLDDVVDWKQKVKEVLFDILPSCLAEAGLGLPPAAPPAPTPAPHASPRAPAAPSTSTTLAAVYMPPGQPTQGGACSDDEDEISSSLNQIPPPSPPPPHDVSPPLAAADFRPYNWLPLPPTWVHQTEMGKLVAYAPDEARPGTWRRLDDVQVRLGYRDGGNPEVLYRAKPLSTPTSLPTKLSPTAPLDAVSVLLNNPRATTSQSHSIDASGDTPCLEFALSAFFPGERSLKPLDVASMLEARLEARQSAARDVLEAARRGVVRAEPLSTGLFDPVETDRVFSSVPTIIQVTSQPPARPRPTPTPVQRQNPLYRQPFPKKRAQPAFQHGYKKAPSTTSSQGKKQPNQHRGTADYTTSTSTKPSPSQRPPFRNRQGKRNWATPRLSPGVVPRVAAPRVGGKSGLQRPLLALDNSATPAPASTALQDMGFIVNLPKSVTTPTQQLDWLGIRWDTTTASLSLAPDNVSRTLRQVRRAYFSSTFSRRQWESLLGVLNFAAPTLPLGRLKHRRLMREVNLAIPCLRQDLRRPIPHLLLRLLRPWLRPGALLKSVPWVSPPPTLTVASDASDVGWGFQSEQGHQSYGGWTEDLRLAHINVRELWIAKEWLLRHRHLTGVAVRFDMDNVTEVQGRDNSWADALSRFRGTSVEWHLCPEVFQSLTLHYRTPQIDLFASYNTAQLPLFLTYGRKTPAGDPDAFTVDWNRWSHIYLFPPPASKILLRVAHLFQEYIMSRSSPPITSEIVLDFLSWLADITNRAPATVSAHPLHLALGITIPARALALLKRGIRASKPTQRPPQLAWASQLAALTRHDAFASVAEDGASLRLTPSPTFLAKNEQADSLIGPIKIPSLLQSGTPHPLCPVAAFKAYVARTQDLFKDHLFYASRSARPLAAHSLACLLCKVIELADPGHSLRVHSIRGLAASLAFLRTHSVERVRDLGGWTSTSSFRARYLLHSVSQAPSVAMGTQMPAGPLLHAQLVRKRGGEARGREEEQGSPGDLSTD
ncbi:hypothetical protein O3P69_006450 [Scylla paramamosain]|uniref:Uncharacterized protein n=1 Tax=Scylla paramamosain TaxID=85552 RepID=A0AAW0U2I4_SCYPA